MQTQGAQSSQNNLEREHSCFQNYYKATAIRTMWYWHKDGHLNQKNKNENPKINPHIYNQLNFYKGDKTIQWGMNSLFNNDARTTRIFT